MMNAKRHRVDNDDDHLIIFTQQTVAGMLNKNTKYTVNKKVQLN